MAIRNKYNMVHIENTDLQYVDLSQNYDSDMYKYVIMCQAIIMDSQILFCYKNKPWYIGECVLI